MVNWTNFLVAGLTAAVLLLAMLLLASQAEAGEARNELAEAKLGLSRAEGELASAKSELAADAVELGKKKSEIANLTASLAAKAKVVTELESELDDAEAELKDAKSALAEAKDEIGDIREEAIELQDTINESIQWFRDNAALPHLLRYDRFMSKVGRGCESGGKLNLACVSFLMENELDILYRDDPGDRLYSIEEIVQRGGGDCEDFSLFFKAVLNGLDGGLRLEAWENGAGRYDVYGEGSRVWYYEDADGRELGRLGAMRPYAACYYYDTEGPEWLGHCIIMLTGADISSPSDITDAGLADAVFFEPQSGEYMGRMGEEFHACETGDDECGDFGITFIITDGDLFQFSEGRWNYYGGHLQRTDEMLSELDAMAGG